MLVSCTLYTCIAFVPSFRQAFFLTIRQMPNAIIPRCYRNSQLSGAISGAVIFWGYYHEKLFLSGVPTHCYRGLLLSGVNGLLERAFMLSILIFL